MPTIGHLYRADTVRLVLGTAQTLKREVGEGVSEQFLNGTSAHIRLFSALP